MSGGVDVADEVGGLDAAKGRMTGEGADVVGGEGEDLLVGHG